LTILEMIGKYKQSSLLFYKVYDEGDMFDNIGTSFFSSSLTTRPQISYSVFRGKPFHPGLKI